MSYVIKYEKRQQIKITFTEVALIPAINTNWAIAREVTRFNRIWDCVVLRFLGNKRKRFSEEGSYHFPLHSRLSAQMSKNKSLSTKTCQQVIDSKTFERRCFIHYRIFPRCVCFALVLLWFVKLYTFLMCWQMCPSKPAFFSPEGHQNQYKSPG